jgi:plasmid stabilization system protein ParE
VTIRFLSVARRELDDAFAWYERQSAGLGYEFLDEMDRVVRRIGVYPDSCAELTHGLRRAMLSRFPYGLVYGREADLIVIVAVAHLHREPRYWMDRLTSDDEEQGDEFRASDKPPTKPARRRTRKP